MLRYIAKRFVMMLITMFIIITATFFLMRAIPGGPFSFDRTLPPGVEEALKAKYNLNKPVVCKNPCPGYLSHPPGILNVKRAKVVTIMGYYAVLSRSVQKPHRELQILFV